MDKRRGIVEEFNFIELLDGRGKRIFQGFKKIEMKHPWLKLRETDEGFHLCIKSEIFHDWIEFIQIWGDPLQRLETRFQMVEKKVSLTDESREKARQILERVQFKDTSGNHGNMKLIFKKLPSSFSDEELSLLMDSVVKAVSYIRTCQACKASKRLVLSR